MINQIFEEYHKTSNIPGESFRKKFNPNKSGHFEWTGKRFQNVLK